jgi:hypothetical protein
MKSGDLVPLSIFAVAAFTAFALPFPTSDAASRNDLTGSWEFVSNTANLDGNRVELFGPAGKGLMMLGADGRYTIVIVRSGLPKFASENRMNGTAEENKAVVGGSNAHFGTFEVDEAASLLIFHIEGATFPNWDRAEQRRSFSLDGDVLKYVIPTSTTGSGQGEVIWKRLR